MLGPIASALSNRFSFRAVVLTGSIFGFVGLSTSSLAQSVDILFFTLGILFGVSIGLIFTPLVVGVGFYFDKRRALATGITVCGSGAGTFVFAPVIYWLLEKYAIRGTFLILVREYIKEKANECHLTNISFKLLEWDLLELCSSWVTTPTVETPTA